MRHALVLAGLLCVLAVPSLARAQYEERYFPVGRFAVMVPDDMEDYLPEIVQDQGRAVIRHTFTLSDASGRFSVKVSYMDLAREPDQAARESFFQEVFAEAAQAPMDSGAATLIDQSRNERLGSPAMELTLDLAAPSGQIRLMVLALVMDSRLYVLKASAPDPDLCARVIKSFWVASR